VPTVRFAVLLAVPAVGVWVVVTPEVVFGLTPICVLVTLKVTVQNADAGIEMPLNVSVVAPANKVDGAIPAQVPPTAPPKALMFTSVSEKAAPVSAVALLFDSVRVTAEIPPGRIDAGLKSLAIVGEDSTITVRLAVLLAAPTVAGCVVITPELLFGLRPICVLVTLKVTVQFADAGMVMPLKVSAVAPAVNIDGDVPAQVPPTAPPNAVMFTSVSEKDAPVSAVVLPFDSVSVTNEFPPARIDVGLNAFAIAAEASAAGGRGAAVADHVATKVPPAAWQLTMFVILTTRPLQTPAPLIVPLRLVENRA